MLALSDVVDFVVLWCSVKNSDMSAVVWLTYLLFDWNILLCGIYMCTVIQVSDYYVACVRVVYVTFVPRPPTTSTLNAPSPIYKFFFFGIFKCLFVPVSSSL